VRRIAALAVLASKRPAEAGRLQILGKPVKTAAPGIATRIIAPPEGIEPSLSQLRYRKPASTGGGYRRLRGAGSLSVLLTVLTAALLVPAATAQASQTLTVEKQGSGTGTVTSSPAGINCGETCSVAFADNEVVVLSGSSGVNTADVEWSGCDSLTISHQCKVTMSSAKKVIATFALAKRKLSVSKTGTGAGTVTSSPAGINCGSTCSAEYDIGTEVALTGTSGANTEAVKWSGCTSIDLENHCLVSMTANKTVTATFDLRPLELSVEKKGSGSGTVTSSPSGINCGSTCSAIFGEGQTVTLTGTPSGETQPVKWAGCDSVTGENKCVVAMKSDREVSAIFNLPSFTLSVKKQGAGTGTVESSPAGLECGSFCSEGFVIGSKVTLTGTAGLHSEAVKWAGCDEIEAGKCIVTMSGAREVIATFSLEPGYALYPVSVVLKGTGKGSATSLPTGISCPTDCSAEFLVKTQITLYATPEPGSEFDHWSVTACGPTSICTFTVNNPRTVNAVFTAVGTRTLSVAKAGSGSGVISSRSGGIECGSSCAAQYDVKAKVVLSAAAQVGSTFSGWSGEGCKGTKNCRVTMNEARNVTATFSKNPSPPAPKCHVPRLKGKTLKRARSALFAHNCSLGKLRKPKGKGKGRLVVRSSKPGAGAVRAAGTRVTLKLVRKKKRHK